MKKIIIQILNMIILFILIMFPAGCKDDSEDESEYPELYPLKSMELNADYANLYLFDDTLFVSFAEYSMSSEYGIYIFNVSTPANPSLTGTINTPNSVTGIAFDSGSIYVLHHDYGIIDQWDSKLIELDGTTFAATGREIVFDESCAYIEISGSYAFATFLSTDYALRTIDLTSFTEKSAYSVTMGVSHIELNGSRAYLSGQSVALEIVDITDPESPGQTGSYANYYNETPRDLCVFDNYAFLCCSYLGVAIVDISNESAPVLAGINNEPYNAIELIAEEDMFFLADKEAGVVVIEPISAPDSYVVKGICITTNTVEDILISGNYVYAVSVDPDPVVDSCVLDIFDVSGWIE